MEENHQEKDSSFPANVKGIREIGSFKELKKESIIEFVSSIPPASQKGKRLWTIWGKSKENGDWICLHVGSSVNIQKELGNILKLMIAQPETRTVNTTFHAHAYCYEMYRDQNSAKYRTVYGMCDEFIIYEILAEEYLADKHGEVEAQGYDIIHYAEVQFAFDYKAWLWNPAPATNGNKEQEILNLIRGMA